MFAATSAVAHEIGSAKVEITLAKDGSYTVVAKIDPEHVPPGPLRASREELRNEFIGKARIGFDGVERQLVETAESKATPLPDWPAFILKFSGRIPAEAKPLWQERIRTAETQGMEPRVEPTIGRWFTAPFRERRKDVVDRVRAMIRATNPRGYAGCCHAISALDLTDRLGAIKLPTLVVVGEEDQGTPVAASRAIHERIAGSRLEILPSAAHLANVEQPDAFTTAVTSFLARQS